MNTQLSADQLNKEAVALQALGRTTESLQMFLQAARAYQAIGDRRGEGRCLSGVGALYKDLGEPREAVKWLEKALVLRRETGDGLGEAVTLTALGPVYHGLGNSDLARESLLAALEITRRVGSRPREGQALYNLAEVASQQGELGPAYNFYRQSLLIANESGNAWKAPNA